ncbi:hypothetical protein [Bacillus sp. 1P06AnD]|uniref:hypothetical protein n=1 Tax=Bacillus sp. 1P06AnD TaxID=3132208 RepID=UPI0039A3F848
MKLVVKNEWASTNQMEMNSAVIRSREKQSWSLFKKMTVVSTLCLGFLFLFHVMGSFDVAHADSLKGNVKSDSGTALFNTIDNFGAQLVKLARQIGVVALVILVVWMGYSLFIKKSAEGLADMKGRLGAMCIAIAFVFFSEKIIGAILGMFGYTM